MNIELKDLSEKQLTGKASPIRYNGIGVVSLKGAAAILDIKETSIRSIFNRNIDQFIEGVDYFTLSHNEARTLSEMQPSKWYAGRNGMVIFTETGIFKLAIKSRRNISNIYDIEPIT